jgi:serine/threonine-protein kinase
MHYNRAGGDGRMIDRTLAHFKITDKLGEGGMGTVYRARDEKLGREVALKLLPEAFAADAERMARFTREAQVLASLNHPNIAGIHSVEEAPHPETGEQLRFLVMELVDGETLEERIERGRLSQDDALKIALQIATGLEEAHERGIVHRDLKPANVKLTGAGQVKILDFGLAKAFDQEPSSSSPQDQRISLSPTITSMGTQVGVLLGTAAYMSPEQARGEPADRRADIWALGIVLMEMLTGKAVHRGKTISDTLASVLAREPEWGELPKETPRRIRRLLERCLEKETRERLRDVGEARIAIERFLAAPDDDAAEVAASPETAPLPAKRSPAPWIVAGVLAVALAATLFVALRPDPIVPSRPMRMSMTMPDNEAIFTGYGSSAMLAPDGSRLAYILTRGNNTTLHLQALDQWEGTLLVEGVGQTRPYQPFFSPDGKWIGFFTPQELRKVPVSGGTPIKLCDADRARGASWGPDGTIVFSPSPVSPLMQVSEAGGEPQPFTELDKEKGESTHRWPQWLPDGRAVLFTSHTNLTEFNRASIELFIPASGERRVLHQGGTFGRYVELEPGSGVVVYANGDSLFGIPFDAGKLETTGSAVPLIERVTVGSAEGSAQFSSSTDGILAYGSGRSRTVGHTVNWIDREGRIEPLWDERQFTRNPRISPDGDRIAFDVLVEGQYDIWIYDVARGVPTRLTFGSGDEQVALWSPDGTEIYYTAEIDGADNIYRKPADGSGEPELVYGPARGATAASFSPDGKTLGITVELDNGSADVALLALDAPNAEPQVLVGTDFQEYSPKISPNGRWVAYGSMESGQPEIYVRSLEGQGKWQISSGIGFQHSWSGDGKELFYRVPPGRLFVADVEIDGPQFRAGRGRELWSTTLADVGFADSYAATHDGERFVIFKSEEGSGPETHEHLRVVLNWHDELRATFGE